MTNDIETTGNPIPLFATDLINQLDRDYPHKTPEHSDSYGKIMQESGIRKLVDILLERLEGTNMEQLKGDMTINV